MLSNVFFISSFFLKLIFRPPSLTKVPRTYDEIFFGRLQIQLRIILKLQNRTQQPRLNLKIEATTMLNYIRKMSRSFCDVVGYLWENGQRQRNLKYIHTESAHEFYFKKLYFIENWAFLGKKRFFLNWIAFDTPTLKISQISTWNLWFFPNVFWMLSIFRICGWHLLIIHRKLLRDFRKIFTWIPS